MGNATGIPDLVHRDMASENADGSRRTISTQDNFIIHFNNVSNIPASEFTSECWPYIRAYIGIPEEDIDHDDFSIRRLSAVIKTPVKADHADRSAIWHCYRDFRMRPPVDSFLIIEIVNAKYEGGDSEVLGRTFIPVGDLVDEDFHTYMMTCSKFENPAIIQNKVIRVDVPFTITIRRVFVNKPPPRFKVIYLVRHGESKWNKAQSKVNIGGLLNFDHPLTEAGIYQAMDLNEKWRQVERSMTVMQSVDEDWESYANPDPEDEKDDTSSVVNDDYEDDDDDSDNSSAPCAEELSQVTNLLDIDEDDPTQLSSYNTDHFNEVMSHNSAQTLLQNDGILDHDEGDLSTPITTAGSVTPTPTNHNRMKSIHSSKHSSPRTPGRKDLTPRSTEKGPRHAFFDGKDSDKQSTDVRYPESVDLLNLSDLSNLSQDDIQVFDHPPVPVPVPDSTDDFNARYNAILAQNDADEFLEPGISSTHLISKLDDPSTSSADAMLHKQQAVSDVHPNKLSMGTEQLARMRKGESTRLAPSANTIHLKRHEYIRNFFHADAIYSSPLTRAIQTAFLVMDSHSASKEKGLTLYSHIREVKKFMGLDSVGMVYGHEIETRVKEELSSVLGRPKTEEIMIDSLHFNDCNSPWWTSVSSYESEAEQQDRVREFISFIRYSDAVFPVFVGHSLFFKEFYSKRISSILRRNRPDLAAKMRRHRLSNATLMALTIEFIERPSGCDATILDADLIFGGGFHGVDEDGHGDRHSPTTGLGVSPLTGATGSAMLEKFHSFRLTGDHPSAARPSMTERRKTTLNEITSDIKSVAKKLMDGLNR